MVEDNFMDGEPQILYSKPLVTLLKDTLRYFYSHIFTKICILSAYVHLYVYKYICTLYIYHMLPNFSLPNYI